MEPQYKYTGTNEKDYLENTICVQNVKYSPPHISAFKSLLDREFHLERITTKAEVYNFAFIFFL